MKKAFLTNFYFQANVSKNLVEKINQPGEYEIKINYLSHINPFGTVKAYQAN